MGLDISVYKNIKLIKDAKLDEDGFPNDSKLTKFWINKHFKGRAKDIVKDGVYEYEAGLGFRAGSYSGYNAWRNQLAKLAGYKDGEDVWRNHTSGPFYELINFSDCEGVIGTKVSKKLFKDFKKFKEKAENFTENPWFYPSYQNWLNGFEMASENGCVSFH